MDNKFDKQKLMEYLEGKFGYVVPDYYNDKTEIVLFPMCPQIADAKKGRAFSNEEEGRSAYRFLFGKDRILGDELENIEKLGVMYVSNVPLSNTEPLIADLIGELEYTRLHRYANNEFLIQQVNNKMKLIVDTPKIKYVVLSSEFAKRYFGGFITRGSYETLSAFQDRVASGTLKILFVPACSNWCYDFEEKYGYAPFDLNEFKRLF